ncbi:hypothetical protein CMO92_05100 [Candidatus Woesearchaeota archaeon]|nr:hypothetical protein [Candidatus Woesearchaeota archaeon]
MHEAILEDLDQDEEYFYKVTYKGEVIVESTFYSKKSSGQLFSFVVFGDSGDSFGNTQTPQYKIAYVMKQDVLTTGFDFMIHTGDVVYDEGLEEEYDMNYFEPYVNLGLKVPMLPSIGNHDYAGPEKLAPYLRNFYLPEGQELNEEFYSFEHGDALFIALNNMNLDYNIGSVQSNWLIRTLRDALIKIGWEKSLVEKGLQKKVETFK